MSTGSRPFERIIVNEQIKFHDKPRSEAPSICIAGECRRKVAPGAEGRSGCQGRPRSDGRFGSGSAPLVRAAPAGEEARSLPAMPETSSLHDGSETGRAAVCCRLDLERFTVALRTLHARRGLQTTAMNIVAGSADRLKAELHATGSTVLVGVPPSGGSEPGRRDRLKAEL